MTSPIMCRSRVTIIVHIGPSWSWSYGCWIYKYLCNRCLSPQKMWVRIPRSWRGVLETILYDQVCQW